MLCKSGRAEFLAEGKAFQVLIFPVSLSASTGSAEMLQVLQREVAEGKHDKKNNTRVRGIYTGCCTGEGFEYLFAFRSTFQQGSMKVDRGQNLF